MKLCSFGGMATVLIMLSFQVTEAHTEVIMQMASFIIVYCVSGIALGALLAL